MRRVDALAGQDEQRLAVLTGTTLAFELDDELQDIVRQTSAELGAPIALVTLVLKQTQFFRAHFGLPVDLASSRATDRDASFCQFVVRDESRFEVSHASADERVPKELVDRYGIEAYLGEPVRVGGKVVGSLCAIDTEPRTFSDVDRATVAELARRVSRRLEELARDRAVQALTADASRPAFYELRNLLTSLMLNARVLRAEALEARALANAVKALPDDVLDRAPSLRVLGSSWDTARSMDRTAAAIEGAARRLASTTEALHDVIEGDRENASLSAIIGAASCLAHHDTKLVGGVDWEPVSEELCIRTPRMTAVAVVSAALSIVAKVMGSRASGIHGRARRMGSDVVVELYGDIPEQKCIERCSTALCALAHDASDVEIGSMDRSGVSIRFAAAVGRPTFSPAADSPGS